MSDYFGEDTEYTCDYCQQPISIDDDPHGTLKNSIQCWHFYHVACWPGSCNLDHSIQPAGAVAPATHHIAATVATHATVAGVDGSNSYGLGEASEGSSSSSSAASVDAPLNNFANVWAVPTGTVITDANQWATLAVAREATARVTAGGGHPFIYLLPNPNYPVNLTGNVDVYSNTGSGMQLVAGDVFLEYGSPNSDTGEWHLRCNGANYHG
jgi:hypothetical protein